MEQKSNLSQEKYNQSENKSKLFSYSFHKKTKRNKSNKNNKKYAKFALFFDI